MTAEEIVTEIQRLPAIERDKVIRFASVLADHRELSGDQLDALVDRLLKSNDPMEKTVLRESIFRGFYGGAADA